MSQIVLVVKINIKKDHIETVVKEFKDLHKYTHELDRGCIQYDYHQSTDNKNVYFFIETWQNQEALDEHKTKEHFLNFVKNTEGMIEEFQVKK